MTQRPNDSEARSQIHAHTHTLDIESLILKEAGFTGKVRDIIDAIIGAAGTRVSPAVFEMDHLTLARRLNHPQARGNDKRDKKAAITYVSRKLNRLEFEMTRTGVMVIRVERGHEEQRTRYEVMLTPVANRAYQRAWASELWKEHPGKAKSAQVAQAIAELPCHISEENKRQPKGESDEKLIKRNVSTMLSLAQKNFEAVARNGGSPKQHYEALIVKLGGLADLAEQRVRGAGRSYVIKRDANFPQPDTEGGIHKSVASPPEVSILEAAINYARRGIPIFPTRPNKTPYTARGFKNATCDEAAIRDWYLRWTDAGIGIPTGSASGLFALDFDNRHGGVAALAELEVKHGAMPPTLVHETGDGYHRLFKYPENLRLTNSPGGLPTGIDVRGEGGYIIAPPSLHPSGKRYRRLNDLPPALPPEWLLKLLTSAQDRVGIAAETKPRLEANSGKGDGQPVAEGNRNDALFRIACAERGRGRGFADILHSIQTANSRQCAPPLDSHELEKIAQSAMRYAPNAIAVA